MAGDTLDFNGTAGGDTLTGIYVLGGTIRYDTNGVFGIDTGVPMALGATPVIIRIFGQGGIDVVTPGLGGFPLASVVLLQFSGGDGDDTFDTRTIVGGTVFPPGPPPGVNFSDANIRFLGGNGVDTLLGSTDPEYFLGENGDDIANGGAGNDVLIGGPDKDTLHGDDDDDTIRGGTEDDKLFGDKGDDTIEGNEGGDGIQGGPGFDTIKGDAGQDTIDGNADGDVIQGGSEGDIIRGDDGDDEIHGDGGNDEIRGEDGWDTIYGGDDADKLFGGLGNDTLWSGSIISRIDQPYGGAGPNPGWPDMLGTGNEACDIEDGRPDLEDGCCNGAVHASDDQYQVGYYDTPLVISPKGILTNDWDLLGTPLTVSSSTYVSHGSLTVNTDGSFTYTQDVGFLGNDTFTYQATNGAAASNVATVTINVSYAGPIALDDSYTTVNEAFTVANADGVGKNDLQFTYVEVVAGSGPANGTLTLALGGGFTYTPNAGFAGVDTFQYKAISASGLKSKPATVTITVVANCQAVDDGLTGVSGTAIAGNVLTNDSWTSGTPSVFIIGAPVHAATYSLASNGALSYTSTSGYTGSDFLTYQYTSDGGTSNVATSNDTYNAQTGVTLNVSAPGVRSNDTNAATVQLVAGSGPSHGSVTLSSDGSFSYTSDNSFYGASDSFQYIATNSTGQQSSAASVTINVWSPTPFATSDSYGTGKNQTLTVNAPGVLSNDQYANAASYVSGFGPYNGTLSLNSNGSFTYTPNLNYTGSDTFRYIAQNSNTGQQSSYATVSLFIAGMLTLDQAPQANSTAPVVTAAEIGPLYTEAVRRWHEAGVTDRTIDTRLASIVFVIVDLPGSALAAAAEDGTIFIDENAAGYGWFIDGTPRTDDEFALFIAPSERRASASSPAAGKADLYTALAHEIGHVLGLPHMLDVDEHNLMHETIGLSTRRNPLATDAALVMLLNEGDGNRRR